MLLQVAGLLLEVFVPLVVALLLAALLQPGAAALVRRGWPRSLAALTMLLVGLLVVAGIITLVVEPVPPASTTSPARSTRASTQVQDSIVRTFPITQNSSTRRRPVPADAIGTTGARSPPARSAPAGTIGEVFTGLLLTLFTPFFFLKDGRPIWMWLVRLFPRGRREPRREAARAGLAHADQLRARDRRRRARRRDRHRHRPAILGVPLALPLAALVFLGAFIPIVGVVLAGWSPCWSRWSPKGPVTALILLGSSPGAAGRGARPAAAAARPRGQACTRWRWCFASPPARCSPASSARCSRSRSSPCRNVGGTT